MNKLILTTLTAVAVTAAPAYAGKKSHSYDDDRDYGTDYAQVLSANPIYRQVRVSEPREECRDERVVYRDRRYSGNDSANALFGAILGGVAGHQFGKGRGNAAATAAGAVIGAGIAQDRLGDGRRATERVVYEPHCTTYTDYRYEERVEGYDVTYRYHGHVYNTRMPYNPGSRMLVHVDVSPVRDY